MKAFRRIALTLVAAFAFAMSCTPHKEIPEFKPFMTAQETVIEVEAAGGTVYLPVESNVGIAANTRSLWCTPRMTTQAPETRAASHDAKTRYLMVEVKANSSASERTAVIILSAAGCDDIEITLIQAGRGGSTPTPDPDPNPDPDPDPFDPNGKSDCDLLTFSIERQTGLASAITFSLIDTKLTGKYLKWIDKTDPQMLIPTFTTNGKEVRVNNTKIYSGSTPISFADDFELTVYAENGNRKHYIVSLNCPQINTELPVIRIHTSASSITSKTTYKEVAIDLYTPVTGEVWWSSDQAAAKIRGRGNSTWGLPKKPYRIKFPEKISPVGFTHCQAKDWNILGHDMDKSLIRNHIAFQVSRALFNSYEGYHDPNAIMFTPASQHVNVYFNDDFHGTYQMTDQMERHKGRIEVDKLGALDGSDPEKIKGGHILESDIHNSEPTPIKFYTAKKNIRFNHKYPDDDDYDIAQFNYIESFISTAENALYGSNFKDPVNGWRKYFDEKTMADYIIVKELVGDMDGYTSTYCYKVRAADKIFFGPVWDCDKGWENDKRTANGKNKTTNLMIYAGFLMPNVSGQDWFQRVWDDETFRAFVARRWAQKKDELVNIIKSELNSRPKIMPKAIEANFSKWDFYYQASGEANMPAKTYELEIERMRTLTDTRVALLDRLFNL